MKNFKINWCIAIAVVVAALITGSCGGGGAGESSGAAVTGNIASSNVDINYSATTNTVVGNQWAFMSGYKLADQYGLYVGLGVTGGLPGTRVSANGQIDSSGNLWLFGGSGYGASGFDGALNDLWRYDTKNQVWTWLNGSSIVNSLGVYTVGSINYPGGRHSAASWIGSDGKLWVLGGLGYAESQNGYLNDLWRYDTKTNIWTWVGGSKGVNQVGVYGTKGVSDSKNIPGGREGGVSWMGTDGKLWLFGGYGYATNSSGTITKGSLNDLWQYDPSSNKWVWVSGSSMVNQSGNYGSKGTPSSGNVPGARYDATSWIDASGNLWAFGGTGFASGVTGLLNDLWKFDIAAKQWTWVSGANVINQSGNYGTQGISSVNNMPGSRSGSVAVVESSGLILLFGGNGIATNNQGYLNDVWQYEIATKQWTWVGGSSSINQAGVDKEPYTFSSGNLPGGRSGMVSWIDKSSHLWLFGGNGYDSGSPGTFGVLGDLWQYIPPSVSTNESNTWTWMSGSDGVNESGIYGVQGVSSPANVPGSREGMATWSDKKNNKLWLFGGTGCDIKSGSSTLSDLWQYNLTTGQWTWMSGSAYNGQLPSYGTKGVPSSTNIPGNREFAGSWMDSNSGKLWLFGGYQWANGGQYKNDLWQYDLSTGYWTWISGSLGNDESGVFGIQGVPASTNMPGSRRGMLTWVDKSGKLWLFGGYTNDGNYGDNVGYFNDLWRYDSATNQWTWMKGANYHNQSGVYGTKGVADAANTPAARENAVGWVDKSGNLWLFGGHNFFDCPDCYGGEAFYGDLWKYDTGINKWTWMSGPSTPSSESGVYGTMGVPAADNMPATRIGAAAWVDESGDLWMFAGDSYAAFGYNDAGQYVNDLWKYNINSGWWAWMGGTKLYSQRGIYGTQGIPGLNNLPGGRQSMAYWVDNDGMFWLFGGHGVSATDYGNLNDLWKYVPPSAN